MPAFNQRLLPRKAQRRYVLIGMHPDIGWHAWSRGPVADGGWLVRMRFFKRGGRKARAGWNVDRARFFVRGCRGQRKKQARSSTWFALYGQPGDSLGNLRRLRFANPDWRLTQRLGILPRR